MLDTNYTIYLKHYDNAASRAILALIERDITYGTHLDLNTSNWLQRNDIISTLINLVINSAMEASGEHPIKPNQTSKLAELSARYLCDDTIEAIAQYLARFDEQHLHVDSDFRHLVEALSLLQRLPHDLDEPLDHTCDLHSKEGRSGYHLLLASKHLITAATLILSGADQDDYLKEKLTRGMTALHDALDDLELKN